MLACVNLCKCSVARSSNLWAPQYRKVDEYCDHYRIIDMITNRLSVLVIGRVSSYVSDIGSSKN